MLGGLTLAVFLYAPFAALDWRSQQEEIYIEALTERSAARLALASARRVAADPTGQAVLNDMETWGFDASNIAVAKVRIEQRLLEEATLAGLTDPRITTDDEMEAIGPIHWLGAEVQAKLGWGAVFGFLDQLTSWPEGFQVESLTYRLPAPSTNARAMTQQADPGDVIIGLSFPVRIDNPGSSS